MNFIYKIERNSRHSKYYLIRKFLPHQQSGTFHIEDSDLGIVSKLLNYSDALVSCAQFNRAARGLIATSYLNDIADIQRGSYCYSSHSSVAADMDAILALDREIKSSMHDQNALPSQPS